MTEFTSHANPAVLVVDDDSLQRREIVRCLRDCDIATIEADNGLGALAVIKEKRPAIIIMDIKMPLLDGVEVVRQLDAGDDYDSKIILVTGDPDSLYRANRMSLRIFGVIEKPLPLRVLLRFVRSAIDNAKSRGS